MFAGHAYGETRTHNQQTGEELILLVLKWGGHVESLKIVQSYVQIAIKYSLYQDVTS